jgi:hypothetical protein
MLNGTCASMPTNAQIRNMFNGTLIRYSWKTADKANTNVDANSGPERVRQKKH